MRLPCSVAIAVLLLLHGTVLSQEPKAEGLPEDVKAARYDGTRESVQKIYDTFIPYAKDGNTIAVYVCREACFFKRPPGCEEDVPDWPGYPARSHNRPDDPWMKLLEGKAKANDGFFQKILAFFHEEGIVVPEDKKAAFDWYTKSASNGYARSMWLLARNFHGPGVATPRNYSKAVELLRKAGEAGDPYSSAELARAYYNGTYGLQKDPREELKWKMKAAEANDSLSQWGIAEAYRKGEGVEKNLDTAMLWYKRSAENGDDDAAFNLGWVYEKHKNDFKSAMEWYQRSVEMGCSSGMYAIGEMYENGRGVPVDMAKAREWYLKSYACDNYVLAYTKIGDLIFKEKTGNEAWKEAAGHYRKALKYAHSPALTRIEKGAGEGYSEAQFVLGDVYFKGEIHKQKGGCFEPIPPDKAEGIYWYGMAASQNHTNAMQALQMILDFNMAEPAEIEKARHNLKIENIDLDALVAGGGKPAE